MPRQVVCPRDGVCRGELQCHRSGYAASYLFNNKPLPERPLLITFDDGYLDNYQNAYPILKKRRVSAVIFLVSSGMEDPARVCGGIDAATVLPLHAENQCGTAA
ncbi:MAG: polysaccharide deacetylase family protein [Anaerolineae bacterium]